MMDFSHPLGNYFGTLAAAKAVYPCAHSLTDEIDWAAIQTAIFNAGFKAAEEIFIPAGEYLVSDLIITKPVVLRGEGYRNPSVSGSVINNPFPTVLLVNKDKKGILISRVKIGHWRVAGASHAFQLDRIDSADGTVISNIEIKSTYVKPALLPAIPHIWHSH